ncbi:MAG TPA: diacylglycerol kinase family protein [Thermomicrobiales bacterium]|jgi:diacylglycerol kinase (ATP)|nr:diacylglycerol kinase family protein [Thermomicrobiales bacterium]
MPLDEPAEPDSGDCAIPHDSGPPGTGQDDAPRRQGEGMDPRVRVILNPHAGSKAGISTNLDDAEDVIRQLMDEHGLGRDLVISGSEDEAVAATRDAVRRGFGTVVAAGGDGTVGGIARELLGTDTALAILPLGSVMNIARMLDLPRDLHDAAQAIADARAADSVRVIDVGRATGQDGDVVFFEAASVGMNAVIFREANRFGDGDWRGLFSAIRVAFRYRPARMIIHLDNRTITSRALMVAIANGPYTGIGFTVAPGASLEDGMFDVRLFRRFSRWELFRHFRSIAFGGRAFAPKAETYRSARVRVEGHSRLPARADSHDLGTTPVTFDVVPAALRIVSPLPPPGHEPADKAADRQPAPSAGP